MEAAEENAFDQARERNSVIYDPDDPCVLKLSHLVANSRPDLTIYEKLYRRVHQAPELSGIERYTAAIVASHLESLGGFTVHSNIGGHGVVGVFANGAGKTVLIRAELDALPIKEQTDLPYASRKQMIDRYGNERPVIHACGHDMNMAALLAAAATLKHAKETGMAKAMVEDGLHEHLKIPVPDVMLAQHVIPMRSGSVAICEGPVLMSADAMKVRVFGGPSPVKNPHFCENAIVIGSRLVTCLPELVTSPDRRCYHYVLGFSGRGAGADFIYHADLLFDIKTRTPEIRAKVLKLIRSIIESECERWKVPKSPHITISERAPLTNNDPSIGHKIRREFENHYDIDLTQMDPIPATEDFAALQSNRKIPYAYWFFGGSPNGKGEDTPVNHSPFFAPVIQPILLTGTDAMALAVLSVLS
ncbi:hypothetical protein AJ79_09251 [Helicocarpus griseus UAMH5409]|uniref:Peptidase M20 dimerisation domain-containing protein n=1 Tax=Helicocarpus griseus UAMH5409 TaxID=1447875 RepID=A0A2B7WLA9_9EURO|nr:hypothetical protein AJ79_09251 [Helicocarpus griseus UAMH5409]